MRERIGYGAGALAVLLAASGCGSDPAPAGSSAAPAKPAAASSAAGSPSAGGSASPAQDAVPEAAWAKWGLKPMPKAPAPPADRPIKLTKSGQVPVFSEVPTSDKVVFITIDDGAEKDPKFVEMLTELKVPITMFLTKDIVKGDYGYFKPLQALGNSIQNHTVSHPVMSKLTAAQQKSQVCDDQAALTEQYGTAPYLFRPPYGDGANTPTLNTAVQECGPRAVVLWRESMQIHDMQYQAADKKLKNGDIILAHFRGPSELKGETMTQMFGELLSRIQEQGFAVARLDDYIAKPTG
ncbi:polysaccharide deacetylase family protein [Kitasatospora sp. YST-16]|uniref:polysaccharide deacetylase family protein n=1 Tax=Kitasatospora sp. YST-16 TaxID=2998080 RepID=UPI002283FB06|nr:polysaccharide deacetylase family protein [Kitasatospora sp. YST-16]WAL76374.1 polysaccharide deacetylase family protein [Kitasatospora sp. YST-16]WNW42407.1 polysaccharide deacetylase family protein [Streptomyces sp. Li-HN-5-13]